MLRIIQVLIVSMDESFTFDDLCLQPIQHSGCYLVLVRGVIGLIACPKGSLKLRQSMAWNQLLAGIPCREVDLTPLA